MDDALAGEGSGAAARDSRQNQAGPADQTNGADHAADPTGPANNTGPAAQPTGQVDDTGSAPQAGVTHPARDAGGPGPGLPGDRRRRPGPRGRRRGGTCRADLGRADPGGRRPPNRLHAGIQRMILDPTGAVLDVGREYRTVTPAQFIAPTARDGGCAFPGVHPKSILVHSPPHHPLDRRRQNQPRQPGTALPVPPHRRPPPRLERRDDSRPAPQLLPATMDQPRPPAHGATTGPSTGTDHKHRNPNLAGG
jgi:hypothetical protein